VQGIAAYNEAEAAQEGNAALPQLDLPSQGSVGLNVASLADALNQYAAQGQAALLQAPTDGTLSLTVKTDPAAMLAGSGK
jgi:hypothetical protein